MFHYRFITFKSYFPFIKEDLVISFVVRASLGMSLSSMFARFYLAEKLPMTYYVCAGNILPPPASSCPQSAAASANFAELLARFVFAVTYLVFSVLVIYEKAKLTEVEATAVTTSSGAVTERRKRLGVMLELGTFFSKMVIGVFHLIIMKVYNESDTDYLATSAGRILVYGTHLFNVPVGYAIVFAYRYVTDPGFRSYFNRYFRCLF